MSKHQGQTDQKKKIELPSSIQQVLWTKRMTAAGGKVGLDIYTHFVGNGSDLTIELSDHSGKKLGSYKEKICGNHFWAHIRIPEDAKDALYAKAKLSKHGLEMKSNPLVILPAIEISNVKWDKEEARRGDILKMSADVKGAPDGTKAEIEIWEYDTDEAHDLITKFPALVKNAKIKAEWEFEYYEDTDDVPTEEESEKGYNPPEYFFRVKVREIHEDSELLEFKDWIEISLVDENREPVPDEEYILILPDGQEKKGQLDSNGLAKEEGIPPGKINVFFPNIDK